MKHEPSNQLIVTIFSVIGTGLMIIISLTTIIGWKVNDAIDCQRKEVEKEVSEVYLRKDVFEVHLGTLNDKIDAVMKAVGARIIKRRDVL